MHACVGATTSDGDDQISLYNLTTSQLDCDGAIKRIISKVSKTLKELENLQSVYCSHESIKIATNSCQNFGRNMATFVNMTIAHPQMCKSTTKQEMIKLQLQDFKETTASIKKTLKNVASLEHREICSISKSICGNKEFCPSNLEHALLSQDRKHYCRARSSHDMLNEQLENLMFIIDAAVIKCGSGVKETPRKPAFSMKTLNRWQALGIVHHTKRHLQVITQTSSYLRNFPI